MTVEISFEWDSTFSTNSLFCILLSNWHALTQKMSHSLKLGQSFARLTWHFLHAIFCFYRLCRNFNVLPPFLNPFSGQLYWACDTLKENSWMTTRYQTNVEVINFCSFYKYKLNSQNNVRIIFSYINIIIIII